MAGFRASSAPISTDLAEPFAKRYSTNTSAGLDIRDVTKRWRRKPCPVLNDVCLQVGPGDLARIHGDNGTGKTTLARIIAGIVLPDTGTVTLDGRPTGHGREFHRRLGFVSAGDRGLYARLTVRDQLVGWARLALLGGAERSAAIGDTIRDFALEEILSARVDRISMGQRQRVRLALAFLHRPTLVLLDEPATSLDEHGRELLAGAVRGLLRRDGIAVWISPETELTTVPATQEWRLRDGRLAP